MARDPEEILDEFLGLLDPPNEEFPWDQRIPFDRAVRDVLARSPEAEVVATRTLDGLAILLFVEDGDATVVAPRVAGVTTTYVGSLQGGLLSRTLRRVDEFAREVTLRFEHERLPGSGLHDRTEGRYGEDRLNQLFDLLRPMSVAR